MKIRLLSVTMISALLALPLARAQDAKKDDQTELGAKMEKANGAWRSAQKQIGDDSKKEDTLAKLQVVKENLEAGLKLEPALTKERPAEQQAKFVADYRDKLKEEIARIDKVIAAVKAGDTEAAKAAIADANKAQKEAHTEFRKKKGGPGGGGGGEKK